MLKIFHAPRSRSLRVLWLCEEMGLPYEVSPVDLAGRRPRAFLMANPAGSLPAVVDGDVVLTESVAILQYICERYGPTPLKVEPAAPNYPDYLQFLVLGEAGLGAPLNAIIGCRLYGQPEDLETFAVRIVGDGFMRRLRLVERQLQRAPYMAGETFTAADISVVYAVGIGLWLGFGERMADSVKAYHARCTDRPAYHRAAAI